jgi:hypothetical protein
MANRVYVKKNNVHSYHYIYLISHGLCKEHKRTISFEPSAYHLYSISGYFKSNGGL